MKCGRTLAWVTAGVLGAGIAGTTVAAPPSANSWQMERLFQPTQADLNAEARGRVMIYDGLTDRAVQRAFAEQFERLDAMMFTRTVVTDESGAPRTDPESGEVLTEEDGCD